MSPHSGIAKMQFVGSVRGGANMTKRVKDAISTNRNVGNIFGNAIGESGST